MALHPTPSVPARTPAVALAGLLTAIALSAGPVRAQSADAAQEDRTARYQITYNPQYHGAFGAPYGSALSLRGTPERMYTFSATAHWGFRPWAGGELYFNPEVVSGTPFGDNLVGLGSFTNGEITRAAGKKLRYYRQRLFLRQTWNQGGGRETVEADANQLAGTVDRNRFVLTVGNFSTLDVFDDNAYAKDPRTQFMNWGHWTYAAYDYAADARGYGWGFAGEWYQGDWVLRFGRMSAPKIPNGLQRDLALLRHYGDQLEVEHAHRVGDQPGKLRVLAWRNRGVLARFDDALAYLQAHPGSDPQAILAVRDREQIKYGLGVNLEQVLSDKVGLFVRWMRADGRTETQAFTEADRSLSAGSLLHGRLWGRADDSIGVAWLQNGLSGQRRRYLEAGGLSFFIGDGALRYRPEQASEIFYSLGVAPGTWLTLDWQHIRNPAYNAARGPLNVFALRLHATF